METSESEGIWEKLGLSFLAIWCLVVYSFQQSGILSLD